MTITSQTMFDILTRPVLEERANSRQMFAEIRGDGNLSANVYCLNCSVEQLANDPLFDCVEMLDPRRDDKCCVCGRGAL